MIYYNFSSNIDYVNDFDIKKNGIQIKENSKTVEIRVDVFRSTPVFLYRDFSQNIHVFDKMDFFYDLDTYSKNIDEVGFWEILLFGASLWTRTLYVDLFQLPSASSLVINKLTKEFTIKRYWDFNVPVDKNFSSIEIVAEKLNEKLNSIASNIDQNRNFFIGLSGGMDSRITLAYLSKYISRDQIRTFTYAHTMKSLEHTLSKVICKRLNLEAPDFHLLNFDSYRKAFDYMSKKSGGQIGINHCHIIDFFKQNRTLDTYISTYFSDAIFGWETQLGLTDEEKLLNPYIKKIEKINYLDQKIKNEIIKDSHFITKDYNINSNFSSVREYIYVTERNQKFHNYLFSIQKEFTDESISFFHDFDLFNLSLSIPSEFKCRKKIEYFILNKYFNKISSDEIGDISSNYFRPGNEINFFDRLKFKSMNRINAFLRILTNGNIQMENKFQTEELERILYQYLRKDLKNAVELFSNMGIIKDYQKSFFNSLPIRSEGVGLKYSLISLSTLFK